MGIYSIAVRTTNNTVSQCAVTLVSSATVRLNVLEHGLTQLFNNASTFGIGFPNTAGVTAAGTANGLAEDASGPSSATQAVLSWSTQPVWFPAAYHRRVNLPATIGSGIIWTFPRGMTVPVSNSMVLYNLTSTQSNCEVWYVWDE